jgi:hypothetical protein
MAVVGVNGTVAGGVVVVVDCGGRLFGVVWCFLGRVRREAVDAGFGGGGGGVAGCPALQ